MISDPVVDACRAARAADERSGRDTVVIDVGEVLAITDHFVITSAGNRRLVRAIVEAVQEILRTETDRRPLRIEGIDTYEWVLIDYGDFIVHVFDDEVREYYQLERLWGDRPRVDWVGE